MVSIFARTPAKLILLGEHYVVHGAPAISAALDMFIYGRLDDDGQGLIRLNVDGVTRTVHYGVASDPIAKYYRYLLGSLGVERPPSLDIEFEFPASAGLGSSASLAALMYILLYRWLNMRDPPREEIYRHASEFERMMHGNPSGIDLATVVEGGVILYRRDLGVMDRMVPEELEGYGILVADTGVRRSTGELVSSVTRNLGGLPEDIRAGLVEVVDSLVIEAWDAIKGGRLGDLVGYIRGNHYLLRYVGVYIDEAEAAINRLGEEGIYGAKVTGAGGGGCIYVFGDGRELDTARGILEGFGFKTFRPNIYPYSLY